jgi:hypothetical protein
MSNGIGLDIRIPIGGMFAIFGAIVTVYGLFSDPAIYECSLGININLWWGLVMFAFGAFMLIMAWRGAKKNTK